MLSCTSRVATLLVVAACFAGPAVAPAAATPQIGIADQKPDMFADARFGDLGLQHARRSVSWDALRYPWQTAELDAWMQAAHARRIDPLITFGHSRVHSRSLPSPREMGLQLRAFRVRYPWATTFATWNETNHCGEKVCRRPRLVAAYYKSLRRACAGCTILAAEVLDLPSMAKWIRAFRHYLGYMPTLWGLHNYVEANRFKTRRLRQLLRLMGRHGKLWLTETGGLVRRSNHTIDFPEGTRHAARVTRYIFDRLAKRFRQIQRVYIYHWNAGSRLGTSWDSALIDSTGHERGAYWVLRRVMLADRR